MVIMFKGKRYDSDNYDMLLVKLIEVIQNLETKQNEHLCEISTIEFNDLENRIEQLENKVK